MKTMLRLFIFILAVSFVLPVFAQVPQKMNYQAVARNSSGQPIVNHAVGVKFTIREGTASGPDIFAETMTVNTNSMGTFSCEIGGGTPVLGSFATIPWNTGPKFLNIKIDPAGGTSYTDMGTYQLLSVAYAQLAKNVVNNDDADASTTNELQTLSIAGDQLSISSGNTVTLPGGGGGGTPGGADGNVQFNNAGAFGGDNEFFWNNTSKFLGVGTNTPAWKLDVTHSGATGIGVKSTSSFSVIDIDAINGDAALRFYEAGAGRWNVRNDPGTDNLQFFEMGIGERMRIEDGTGNFAVNSRLGVGTSNAATLGGKMEILHNTTTSDVHLLLNETDATDYARLAFKNATPNKVWHIAGRSMTDDASSLLNFWYWNGTSAYDVLSITGDKKIGINTVTPEFQLDIFGGASHSYITFKNDATNPATANGLLLGVRSDNQFTYMWNFENTPIVFATSNTSRMTIAADGKVGIGDATPDATLDVEGTAMIGAGGTAFTEIKEITGTTVASGNFTLIAWPAGYTMANTRILSCEINYGGNAWVGLGGTTDPAGTSGHVFYYNNAGNIWLYHQNTSAFTNRAYRILLMKM